MSKDIRTLAAEARKALEELDKACQEVNPDFGFNDRHDGSMALVEAVDTLYTNAFLDQFNEQEFTVKAWIAVLHTTKVKATSAEAAIAKVAASPEDFSYDTWDFADMGVNTEHVLDTGVYELTAEPTQNG